MDLNACLKGKIISLLIPINAITMVTMNISNISPCISLCSHAAEAHGSKPLGPSKFALVSYPGVHSANDRSLYLNFCSSLIHKL